MRDAGGSRTHFKLLCRQPPRRLAPASTQVSPPGIEPGPRPSQSRMRIRHNPRTVLIHQHPAEESNLVRQIRSLPCFPSHSQGIANKHERKDSNPVRQFWRLSALPGAHSHRESRRGDDGYPKGFEPLPPGSQPGMQQPLHHGHHTSSDQGGNRTHRVTCFSACSLCPFAYLIGRKLRVRGSHPAVQAYEARMSTGSPALSK